MRVVLAVGAVLYVLHQDIWLWRVREPLVFGFLPVGMAYHAAYTALIAVVLAVLARKHWPAHLEDDRPTP
jgi:hypothetical protein